MINKDFFSALDALEAEKGISKEDFIRTLEQALVFAYKKHFGTGASIEVKLNAEKSTIKVFASRNIVETVEDIDKEISLEEAVEIKKGVKIGDQIVSEVTPKDFGRIAAQTAKQVVLQRIKEFEKENTYNEYCEKENELLTCVIRRFENDTIFVDLGKGAMEGVLTPQDQIKGEKYKVNDRIRVLVKRVRNTPSGTQILVSRSSAGLVRKLFEMEVPEIKQGLVEIMAIAREAGQRTKIAIMSKDSEIDAVGSCVGNKGVRVNAIVAELSGEKIDIIEYSENPLEYIARSLSPAEVKFVEGDEQTKIAKVIVPDDKLSLAIGREGQNARLAARLTGWKIDVKSQSVYNAGLISQMDALKKEVEDLTESIGEDN